MVIEATGNAAAVVDVLSPYVDRVVIANPKQVRMALERRCALSLEKAISIGLRSGL